MISKKKKKKKNNNNFETSLLVGYFNLFINSVYFYCQNVFFLPPKIDKSI